MFGTYRFFLAFLVIVTHIGHVEVLGGLAVWGFFMLSGFLITGVLQTRYGFKSDGLLAFATSRALRLYPTYWTVALLTILITVSFHSDLNPQLVNSALAPLTKAREWLSAVFIIPHTSFGIDRVERALVPPIWAVDVEIFLYLLSCVFVSRSRRATKISLIFSILLFPLLWIAARAFIHIGDIGTAGQLLYSFIPAALLPYSIGAFLYFSAREEDSGAIRIQLPHSIGVPVAASLLVFIALVVSRYSNTLSYIVALPILSYLTAILATVQSSKLKPIDDFLGLMSYPMYLGHYLCAYLVVIFAHKFSYLPKLVTSLGTFTFNYTLMGFLVITCFTLIFSAILALFLERPIEQVRRTIAARLASLIYKFGTRFTHHYRQFVEKL